MLIDFGLSGGFQDQDPLNFFDFFYPIKHLFLPIYPEDPPTLIGLPPKQTVNNYVLRIFTGGRLGIKGHSIAGQIKDNPNEPSYENLQKMTHD